MGGWQVATSGSPTSLIKGLGFGKTTPKPCQPPQIHKNIKKYLTNNLKQVILCKVKMLYKEVVFMQIEELNLFASLFDIYGNLLSNTQKTLFNEYLNFNLSESELAESTGSTRQSVHDAITKAKKQLLSFEQKCGIFATKTQTRDKLENLKSKLSGDQKLQVDDIINNL